MAVKNALYSVLRADLPVTIDLLHGFSHPNVGRERLIEFLNALINRVERGQQLIRADVCAPLTGALRDARKLPSLPFLEGEAAGLLIDTFRDFYISRIALFSNSQHILDDESGIPASDVVAGIMAKLFDYVIRTSARQINQDLRSLYSRQADNVNSVRMLVNASIAVSPVFVHVILSTENRERVGIILK